MYNSFLQACLSNKLPPQTKAVFYVAFFLARWRIVRWRLWLFGILVLCPSIVQAQEEKAPHRHIVVAYDISRSMWVQLKPRGDRQHILMRVNDLVTDLLFLSEEIRANPSKGDTIISPGTIPRPLARRLDRITLFRFGKEIHSPDIQNRARQDISRQLFKDKLPNPLKYWMSMRDNHSLIVSATVQAFRYLQNTPESPHYLVLVSDGGDDAGSKSGKLFRQYQRTKRQLALLRRNIHDKLLFSYQLAKHITISVFQLEHIGGKKDIPLTASFRISKVTPHQILADISLETISSWRTARIKSALCLVSAGTRPLLRQAVETPGENKWPQVLSIAVPWNKVQNIETVNISMQLEFFDPKHPQLRPKTINFSNQKLPLKRPECLVNSDCSQVGDFLCRNQRCVPRETPEKQASLPEQSHQEKLAEKDSNANTSGGGLWIFFGILFLGGIGYLLYKFFFPPSGETYLKLYYQGPSSIEPEVFYVENGDKIYLYEKLYEKYCFDVNAQEYVLERQKGRMILHMPGGREQEVELRRELVLPRGILIIEEYIPVADDRESS